MGWRALAAVRVGPTLFALIAGDPFPARAQRARTPYRVGVVNDAKAGNHPTMQGLKAGLRDLGLEEGRDVVYDVALTDGDPDQIAAAGRALVRRRADVIFASGEAGTRAGEAAAATDRVAVTLLREPGA